MHTSIVVTRSRSREVAKQVAVTNARIRACYPNQSSRIGQAKYPKYKKYTAKITCPS